MLHAQLQVQYVIYVLASRHKITTIQYNTVQYSTIQSMMVKYTIQYSAILLKDVIIFRPVVQCSTAATLFSETPTVAI